VDVSGEHVSSIFSTAASYLLHAGIDPEDDVVAPKHRLTFNGRHDVISQKTELFITAGVRT
jgi:hypothetical protein